MIQFSDMETYVAVVESTSFTIAAKRLATTKSVVSRRISDMERQLGAQLLDRSSRSVRATDVGAAYYGKCVRILEEVEAANDFVSCFNDQIVGRLRIAIPEMFGNELVYPLLTQFSAAYPEVVPDIHVDDESVNLTETHFDVAIRIGKLADSNLIAKHLMHFRRFLCASPEYLAEHGKPLTANDLAQHDGLIDGMSGRQDWMLTVDGQPHPCPVRERLRSNSTAQLLEAACAGLGIWLAPSISASQAIASGRLQVLLPQLAPEPTPMFAVYPKGRRTSRKVQAFLSFLSANLARFTAEANEAFVHGS